MQTIELDCPPGNHRPWHLIHAIIEGTGLTLQKPETDDDHSATWFGHAVYGFEMGRDEWVTRIQPIVRPRIEALYAQGTIRAGSW